MYDHDAFLRQTTARGGGGAEDDGVGNGTRVPSASPTFVYPVAMLYLSARRVPGDFARRESPEAVCEEEAHARYRCERVSALISTSRLPLRRRARGLKHLLVAFESHHVAAHDVSELWTSGFELALHESVWTGTDAVGGVGDEHCDDWTQTGGRGITGMHTLVDDDAPCAESRRLLCVCRSVI